MYSKVARTRKSLDVEGDIRVHEEKRVETETNPSPE